MDEPLLSGYAPDEQHVGAVERDPVPLKGVDTGVGSVLIGVDPVVHDVHARRIHAGVRRQHIAAHAFTHGDDGLRMVVRRRLGPGAHPVSAAELLLLPRAQRLQGVGSEDMGNAVQQSAHVTGKVGVPGVGMEQIHIRGVVDHLQVDPDGLQGRVRPGEFGGHRMGLGIRSGATEAMDLDADQWREVRDEFAHVDTRSPIDVRGPLTGEDADLHGCSVGPAPQWAEV